MDQRLWVIINKKEWTWARIKQNFKGKVLVEDEELLKTLYEEKYHASCFNGQASVTLTALIKAEQMKQEDELAKFKSEIQEFKIFEAFGESAPHGSFLLHF